MGLDMCAGRAMADELRAPYVAVGGRSVPGSVCDRAASRKRCAKCCTEACFGDRPCGDEGRHLVLCNVVCNASCSIELALCGALIQTLPRY
jgi:hypothetical protein